MKRTKLPHWHYEHLADGYYVLMRRLGWILLAVILVVAFAG